MEGRTWLTAKTSPTRSPTSSASRSTATRTPRPSTTAPWYRWPRGPNDRVTRAVWDAYATTLGGGALEVIDMTGVADLWDAIADLEPDANDWRVLERDGRTFWMVPNEIGGLTLMFPSDR